MDPKKISISFNNAQIYKVHEKIKYINKSFLDLDPIKDFTTLPSVIFVSPPWGGVNYAKEEVFDLYTIKPNFEEIIKKSFELANNLVLFLPRNINLEQLAKILLKNTKLFGGESKECIITIEALIYEEQYIKALLINIGPMFTLKTQNLIIQIKSLFKIQLEAYESIIIQNVIKGKSFTDCYEIAVEAKKKNIKPKDYISMLKNMFTQEKWEVIKKLHKIEEKTIDAKIAGKRSLPENP